MASLSLTSRMCSTIWLNGALSTLASAARVARAAPVADLAHLHPGLPQRLREHPGRRGRRVGHPVGGADHRATLVGPQRVGGRHDVVGHVVGLPGRVDRRAGEQGVVVAHGDAADAVGPQPARRLPGERGEVGAARVGAEVGAGVGGAGEQRVAAADEHHLAALGALHHPRREDVVGAERQERRGRRHDLRGGGRDRRRVARPVDHRTSERGDEGEHVPAEVAVGEVGGERLLRAPPGRGRGRGSAGSAPPPPAAPAPPAPSSPGGAGTAAGFSVGSTGAALSSSRTRSRTS